LGRRRRTYLQGEFSYRRRSRRRRRVRRRRRTTYL